MITKSILKKSYIKRKLWCHKGDSGRLLVIGGNKKYTGSPALVGLAAYRSGTDLVTIAAPERPADIAACFSPDLITVPLKGDCIKKKHIKTLLELSKGATALAIGSRIGREKETVKAVCKFLEKTDLPTVIDAEGIRAVAGKKEIIAGKKFILTPHADEFYALSGIKVNENIERRTNIVKKTTKTLKTTILLKGHIDIISDGKKTELNKTGNPYMTVGGTGDVLSGICGALLAGGASTFDAACAAAYICGRSGDIAAKELKEGLMASDIIDLIPYVIR